ncbi:dihydrodipicolinate synthase family protein [Mangrovicoccus ximenensis]|uniref:dihydrodipicolinate synthase family protein n=1 Tax=Mangrovicoccus ximenensis TaxID=1911570 RepID=UPI000D354AF2|nr:dihydrodipicolinate synthase family protein [Mangrovicoccus ximenensis]
MQLSGIVTATPTPLLGTGRIDRKAAADLANALVAAGTEGLAPIGGTGEATALTAPGPRSGPQLVRVCRIGTWRPCQEA